MPAVRVRRHLRAGHPVRPHARWVIPSYSSHAVEWIPTQEVVIAIGDDYLDMLQYANDRTVIARLTNRLKRGWPVDPIQAVRRDGVPSPKLSYVDDGHHRTAAAVAAGVTEVPVRVFSAKETGALY